MSGPNLQRERDARENIRAALESTGVFDSVYLGAFPTLDGQSSGDLLTVWIEPSGSNRLDPWSGGDAADYIECRVSLTFNAREQDGKDADAEVERLYAVASNILTGSRLGGLALPAFSRMTTTAWRPAVAPGRRLDAVFTFRYLVDAAMNVDL